MIPNLKKVICENISFEHEDEETAVTATAVAC